jgi:hypothetical protein
VEAFCDEGRQRQFHWVTTIFARPNHKPDYRSPAAAFEIHKSLVNDRFDFSSMTIKRTSHIPLVA